LTIPHRDHSRTSFELLQEIVMNHLSVGKRLYLLVGLLATMAILLTTLGLRGMSSTVSGLKTVYEDRVIPLGQLGDVRRLYTNNLSEVLRAFQHNPQTEISKLHDHPVNEHTALIELNIEKIAKNWSAYKASRLTSDEAELATEFEEKYQQYLTEIMRPTVKAIAAGDFSLDTTNTFMKANRTLAKDVDVALIALEQLQQDEAKNEFDSGLAAYQRNTRIAVIIALLGIGGALAFAAWVIRSITVPLTRMQDVISTASQHGDFTQSIDAKGNDEVAQTARAFNALLQTLRTTFSELRTNVNTLDAAAHSLVNSAGAAAGSSAQASDAASSMAASVEQLSVSVNHIADNARDASGIAVCSGELSEEGGRIIRTTTDEIKGVAATVRTGVSTIAELGQQSERITAIINVIKDVADQTNLLALNAAIEAARAGEQGRGFAVVADEVRKLAERTAAATGEIGLMISAIQHGARASVDAMNKTMERVDASVGMAQQAEASIGNIRGESEKVVRTVNEITTSLAEQSSASTALAQQVERVAQAAEANSATAGQTADAARHLGALAESMQGTMSRYTV
jgi:methyl-accepting chemotaxis protein